MIVAGIICLLLGALFFWLNNNSPVQTPLPAFLLPLGAVLIVGGIL